MRRVAITLAVLTSLAFPAAGCGGDDNDSAGASATATQAVAGSAERSDATASKRRGVKISSMSTPEGRILVGPRGQVLYLFTKEKSSRSRCYGDCADAWPPAYTRGKPRAGAGVDASLLGTTKRRDGKRVATYNGHPLYFYAHEEPRQVLCQAVVEFGGTWLVVAPSGDAILDRFSVT